MRVGHPTQVAPPPSPGRLGRTEGSDSAMCVASGVRRSRAWRRRSKSRGSARPARTFATAAARRSASARSSAIGLRRPGQRRAFRRGREKSFERFVDVGGGAGALLGALAERLERQIRSASMAARWAAQEAFADGVARRRRFARFDGPPGLAFDVAGVASRRPTASGQRGLHESSPRRRARLRSAGVRPGAQSGDSRSRRGARATRPGGAARLTPPAPPRFAVDVSRTPATRPFLLLPTNMGRVRLLGVRSESAR